MAAALWAAVPARALVDCTGPNTFTVPGSHPSIGAAIAAIPQTLPGPWCVNITNSAIYNEQVTVQNFTNNGSSITIQAAAGQSPSVVPALGGFAIFNIANASVNVTGIRVSPTVAVNYGIYVSSPNVTITSVSVLDTMSMIDMAGIALSSWTTVSYSSVSVTQSNAAALWLQGSTMTTVSYSSAVNNSGTRSAVYLDNARNNEFTVLYASNTDSTGYGLSAFTSSTNTITRSRMSGGNYGAVFDSGSHYNSISLSTMIGNTWAGLYLSASSSNTVTQSYVRGGTWGAWMNVGADYNSISLSTMIGTSSYGFYVSAADSETVTQSYMWGGQNGARFNASADYNSISLSTMIGTNAGLFAVGADSNVVTQSYIWGSSLGVDLESGADYNIISLSVVIGNIDTGLYVIGADSNTVTQSFLWGSQNGVYLDVGSDRNAISLSSMTGNTSYGFRFVGAASNTVTQSYLWGGSRGAWLDSGSNYNAVSLSTMIGSGTVGLYANGVASNTVTQSYMWGGNYGAALFSGAIDNFISLSTMVGNSNDGLYSNGATSNTVTQSYMSGIQNGAVLDTGSNYNAISLSTMIGNTQYGLQLVGADSNTVTQCYLSGGAIGSYLSSGSDYNAISLSTMIGTASYGLSFFTSGWNTLTRNVMWGGNSGVVMGSGSDYNAISLSSMTGNGQYGLNLSGASSNTVTQSWMSGNDHGAYLDASADRNTISLSTMINIGASLPALHIRVSSANVIHSSYVQGWTAAVVNASTGTVINSSVLVATSGLGTALALQGGGLNLTVTSTTLRGGAFGRGLFLDVGNSGVISIGSVTVTGTVHGLEISNQATAFALAIDSITFRGLTAGATAIHFLGGTFASSITLANFEDTSVDVNVSASALNILSRITMSANYGVRTGSTYENDPSSLVDWEAGPYPGCVVTNNVGAGQTYGTIQTAINALPTTLTGRSCVVIRDGAIYNEQVTVRNFTNNGSSITILGDPALSTRPAIVPALGGFAIFNIANASVTVAGIRISPTVAVNYGIYISSPNVTISSVSVLDTMSMIDMAGIAASSWTTVSYSSVSVNQLSASALWLQGSTMTTVAYSTAANNSAGRAALFLDGASSNTITGVVATNQGAGACNAVRIENGIYNSVSRSSFTAQFGGCSAFRVYSSSFNTLTQSYLSGGFSGAEINGSASNAISLSTVVASGAGSRALYLAGADSNTVTGSYLQSLSGYGALLDAGADYNAISQSSMVSNGAGMFALYLTGSDGNTVSDAYISNEAGDGTILNTGADYNSISQSTINVVFAAARALTIIDADSNTVTGSYIASKAGDGAYVTTGAECNTIILSTMVSNSASHRALHLLSTSSNTIAASYITNPAGDAALLNSSNDNTISLSTMTSGAVGYAALWLSSSDSNTVTGSYAANPSGYGALLTTGADYNVISLSVMASNGIPAIGAYALDITGSSSNTVTGSFISNPLGYAAFINNAAAGNMISLSTITSGGTDNAALFLSGSSSDTIQFSYIQGSTAVIVNGSTRTVINSSVLVATNTIGSALVLRGQGFFGMLTVASSTLRGGPSGRGLLLDSGNTGAVSIGSVTVIGSRRGLEISTQATGFVLAIDSVTFRGLTAGATAIHYLGGTFTSSITLANFEDASVGANVSAAALDPASRISMFAHYGVRTSTAYENDPGSLVHWEAGTYPGCTVTRNVGLGQPYNTISAGVAALPTTLTGHSCVVIRDTATYSGDLVVVQGFTNNGSSITIRGDAALAGRPSVRMGFVIYNASVNIANVDVVPNVGLNTGIFVSSPNVTISSVSVIDPTGNYIVAGIVLSSWTTVSYTSVTVNHFSAAAIWLPGSTMTTVAYSTAVNNSDSRPALFLDGASSNTITGVVAVNQAAAGCNAVRIDNGNYNSVSLSSFTASSGGCSAFRLYSSSFNSVTQSYLLGSSRGADLNSSAFNTISLSTVVGNSSQGLYGFGADSNTVTQSYFQSNNIGAYWDAGSDDNTISLSTMVGNGTAGLYIDTTASSNSVTRSYMWGSTHGLAIGNSNFNAISLSTMIGSTQNGLYATAASSNTVTQSYMWGGQRGAWLDANSNGNSISLSTMIGNATVGLYVSAADSNTVTQSYLWGSGYGAYLGSNADGNTISLSAMFGNSNSGLYLFGADANNAERSYMWGGNSGAFMDQSSDYNTISLSTVISNSVLDPALYFLQGTSNTVHGSYIQGSTAALVSNSIGIAIESSVLVATSTIGSALAVQNQGLSGLVIVASTTLRGGPSGRGLGLNQGNQGAVTIGSVTVTGTARGLEIDQQMPGFLLTIDSVTFRGLTAGATAIHYLGGTFTSSITLANFEDTSVGANVYAGALNILSRISMFAHYGVRTSTAFENDPNSLVGWEAGLQPGCVVTRNVGAGQPFATIQAGVNALPTTLIGHSCVVIRDGATYSEQVTVSDFTNNSSSITIMSDPASSTVAPRVSPPPASAAAFRIMNSSVNLIGIEVRPSGGVTYGISVTSPNVTISSVVVYDPFNAISMAGISLSSWVTVSYTSVTMNNTIAFWLQGTNTTVSYSSATNNTAGGNAAVQLTGASSNTLVNLWARNTSGTAVRFDGGGGNTVSQSSFTSQNNEGLYLNGSATNTISGTWMGSSNGYGLRLESSNRNSISQSTASSNMAASYGLYLNNSSSNSISGVFASNPQGYGAYLFGSSSNTISLSTITSASGGEPALYITMGSSNTITGSYMGNSNVNGVGAYFFTTSSNVVSQSTVAGGANTYGLRLVGASGSQITNSRVISGAQLTSTSNENVITGSTFTHSSGANNALHIIDSSSNTISQCFMSNTLGYGLWIGGGAPSDFNVVSQSTITSNATALSLKGTGNSLVSDYIAGGTSYGAEVLNLYYGSILQSTITNNSSSLPAMYLWGSATNTITQSVIVNSNNAGNGMLLDNGSNWNSIAQSVVKGGASGIKAQLISGLNIALSSVTGGSGAANAGVWGDLMTDYITITNSYVQGSTGVYLNGSSRTIVTANMLAASGVSGSGFYSTNNSETLTLSANTVLGGGEAGIGIDMGSGGLIRLSTNTVISRTARYGIGVALLSPTASLWVTSNTIIPALSAAATTYGVYLELLAGGATVQNNGIYYRTAGAAFAGVGAGAYGLYAAQVTGLRVDHNRISNPSMVTSGNYIGAGLDAMSSAIFKFNDLYSTGSGVTTFNHLRITGSPNTVVRNNILSSSMTATANRIILVDAPSQAGLSSDYNTFFSSNSSYNGYWGASQVSLLLNWITTTGGRDASTLSSNPRWVNPAGEDFHPLSRQGRWNGAGFVQDAVDGSGTDRGDTADSVDDEVEPNGARANQGSYGQTAEASQTVLPCPVTRYVKLSGGDATTITGGLAALDNPLSGYSCVVIADSRIYNEQVTVQGFINNGSSITIMLDPALTVHPTVRSGFVIKNASVNIVNIDVIPDNGLAYGILASSANITISSVNVNESFTGGAILTAGVALSSYSSLSYSSVAVQNAHGVRLDGKFAVVSYSTMTSNSVGFNALYIGGAASNTVTASYLSNPLGYTAVLDPGADYNAISQSTITSGAANFIALHINNAKRNTVTGSYMEAASGYGVLLGGGASFNTISFSTMVSNDSNRYALYLNDADSNTVTGSLMQNFLGYGAFLQSGSDNNTIGFSTMTSNAGGRSALYILESDSNTVTGSYIANPAGYGAHLASGADFNTIDQSVIEGNGTPASGVYALYVTAAATNTVTRSYIKNPLGYAAFITGGASRNTISLSTITSSGVNNAALTLMGSALDTIQNSYIQGSTAVIVSASNGTTLNSNVLVATNTVGSAMALQAASVGLSMSSNTIIPGAQGAGIYLDDGNTGTIALSTNTVRGGRYGLYIAAQQAGTSLWISANTILPVPVAAFNTYGIYLNGLTSGATIQNNGVYYRTPGVTGGNLTAALGTFGCDGLVVSGNRFSNPGMVTGGSIGTAYVETTNNTVFKFNDFHSTGTALANAYLIYLQSSPGTQVRGNVFSSSWTVTSGSSAIGVDAGSQAGFLSNYNNFFSSNSLNSIVWGLSAVQFPWAAAIGQDGNSIARHPRWKDLSPGAEDFHHLSQAGRWDGAGFVNDGYTSALIDAADPVEPFVNEPASNGSRANLGSYGNTAEASKSPAPPTAPAVAGVFTSSISVSYGLVSADGYVTYASTAFDFTGTVLASSTANGALALLAPQGLSANTTYYLKAGAVWGDYIAYSGVTLATSTLANPAAAASPAFVEVNVSSLTVSWLTNGNTVDVTTYSVVLTTGASYPNAFAGNQTFSTVPVGVLPTGTRTGLAPNTTYFAFVAGINWNGVPSAYAAVGSTSTLAADPATAVTTFTGVGFSSFTVSWSANGNPLSITTYTVTVSTAPDFNDFASSFTFSTAPAFGPSATFTGLGANETYFFRVRALNHQGIASDYAVLGSTLTRPVTLQAPAIAGVTVVNISSITATWGLSALATGYTLVASLTNNPLAVFASSAPVGINATTATVFTPALNPNTTYFLFVQANGPGAATGFSAYPATATLADLPVTAVTTFTVVNLTSMTVSWLPGGNPIDVTTYTVVLSTGISYPNAFSGNRMISTMPAGVGPAASIVGLNDNTLYYLHVAAVNHNGRASAYAVLGSTVTRISAPSTVVFDEISSNTIVASAYAATPFFSNLGIGQSGTQISRNGTYQPVHGEQWVSTTALPAPLSEAGAAGFNSLVYIFGGINGVTAQKSARVYDPATNLWSSLPDISSTRYGIAGAFAGGKIYAVGGTPDGGASLSVNEEYDPAANVWATKTGLPTAADHLSAVGVGGGVYAFGGVNGGTEIDQTAQFDPVTNAWTTRPVFLVAQTQMAAAAAAGPGAGVVIAAGGAGPANSNYGYNTAANTWAARNFMPAAVEQGAAASLGGKIYVIGGALSSQGVYEYDVAADTWAVRANMITGRAGLSAVAAGGHIYAMGGSADGGATSLNTNEAYDPGVATKFTALTPNTLVNFRARARNQTGTLSAQTATISTYTWAALPGTVASPFAVVEVDSVTFSWALNSNPGATEFKTRASTSASYGGGAAVLVSDWGAMTSTATLALTPNSTYFFSVQARNVPGITTAFVALGSTSTLAAVPASAPVQFGAAATNALTVSWLPNGNPVSVTTYTVVVSTEAVFPNANTGNVTVASTQPAGGLPTATVTGLVANTTYFAFASAVNWNGLRTVYASLGSTSTLALPPAVATPFPTFAAVYESSATYSWGANTNPVDVTTYSVVLSTGSSFNSFAGNVGFSTSPSGTLPTATAAAGLIPNTTYFGYAAAINWNGAVSAYTALGSTATLAVLPATAVSTFSAVYISSLTVSWSAGANPLAITSYTVTLSTASDFNAFATSVTFTTAPVAGPSATFTGLTDFTQYFFQVRAVNHGGNATAFVSLGSTTTVIAPLGVPALAGFPSVDITSITATWGLVTGATGYTFVASLLPANPPVVIEASSTTMSIAATTAAALAPPLTPNTSYFLFVQANGPLRSSLFAAYGATSTLASPPLTAVSTFTGVGITSFTVNWDTNGNALAITTYTVQLSTAPDFNAFATSVTFTTAPVFGPSMMLTGLSGNTSYYLRIRALNHNGVPSAFVNLGSTLTVVSPLFPSILDSQTGDISWRRSVGTLYQVAFLDTSGSHLDKFQVSASTTAGGLGSDVAPLTDVIIGLNPLDSYSTPWALPASVFNSLIEGVTNYITVKVFNGPPLNNFTVLQDAFYVQKDTTAPVIVNTQTGDAVARSVPGTTYTVGVRDPSSGLAAFQYSASLVGGSANAAVIPWTDIPVPANTTSYTTPWPVDFASLISGVTNYISVRSWDTAGTTTTLADAFFVHKDTTGPSVAIAAPQNSSFNSALATLSGTAASIYGVQGTEVSVLDILSGLYWNPASVAFNSAAPVMMPAAGTTAWSLSPGIPWVNGANYRAVARSSTTANIYSATYATATFVMDLSAPTVVVQAPVPNSTVSVLPVLSGTSADPAPNPSGLSSVEVRLRRNTDGLWWNWFTQVWGPTAVSSITAGTAAWSLSPTSQLTSNLDAGTSYFIAVRGSDNALPANQGDFFVSGATFTWQDVTPPAAVTDLATAHGALPGSINLSWTAPGDDAGAGSISLGEYRIFYSTDIAAVASTSTAQVIISTAGVNPGAAQFRTLSSLSPGVTYYISLALADSDGNWSAFSNQASTTAAPSPLNAITGHVLDISTQGITAVQVDCWNAADALVGTTFTLADGSGTFSVTSLPAGSYKLRVTWTVNGFSSSLWQDGITMGSTNVDFFLNIDYALATLTGTLSSLTAASFGGPSAAGLGVASAESFIELHQQGRQVARTMVQPGGRWSIPGLLPGTYSVRAHTGLGYTAFQDVQLSEGEVRVLAFVFDPLPAASVFAFPNPARTSTTIRFETALAPLEAGIYIFDLVGNLVKEFSNSQISRMGGGLHHVVWNLNNSVGQSVAPGVYNVMIKIRGGSDDQSAKVVKKLAVVR